MKLEKMNPWNWFKHEDDAPLPSSALPVYRNEQNRGLTESPIDSFMALHRHMDRLFDDAFRSFGRFAPATFLNEPLWATKSLLGDLKPKTDVAGDKNSYEITLDLPGLSEADVGIELQNRVLTIRGQKESSAEEKDDKKFYRVERHFGSFQRVLTLPDDASGDDIVANMKDGVLTLTIPRTQLPEADKKRIPIQ